MESKLITFAIVVFRLPRARVVYCSATAVSNLENMAFMNRLGLWGYGTEHSHFSQFFKGVQRFGCGAMELHAMHLKGQGALVARTLSYNTCEFEPIVTGMDEKMTKAYNG